MSFSSLGLSPALLKAVTEQKYKTPYPIQKEAIPAILSGKDILGIAQTGSGKTAGFVLPVLEQIQKNTRPLKNRHIKALVMVPTRELAVQINTAFNMFGKYLPVKTRSLAVYGGVSINPQMIDLQGVNILVATPGRLLDLISAKATSLSEVEILVLDEADKMLNLGFKEEMTRVLNLLPARRQTLLFSATLSEDLSTFQKKLLRQPVVIKVEEEKANLDLIEQTAYLIPEEKKGPLLRYLIKHENMQQVLVFTSSVHRADAVVVKLQANGIKAEAIHSKKSQGNRTSVLRLFKEGKLKVLVATDLIARGIDIEFLPYVINYELPRSPKDYVHRIGRTGRAGSKGNAIAFVSPEDEHHFKIIQKKMGKRATQVDGNALNLQGV
ncbi:DEAD/DEAH box helicase [Marinilabilia salmonicolor]|jgi:ATP-dependent RNA helicase RhlE|uniref:ATP-dependent RNA helicase RhlE n=1 Tax=Marinilabilia salmonicolor TaxID=989 RepID=A0A2T0XS68_9BACT|nr:DEAD/DEAH box helicase [Marinilabilia salmonicolor]PRZ01790.1 ATP-dependent RNA helicase RhlE [Marinilabilia salmonicolor]RCW31365.1 ATP-dependent RNA helicase RhlE [Marinilabilia salmonicolor]